VADGAGGSATAELVDFLAAGPAPVLVSFVSMAAGAGQWLSEVVVAAVRRTGLHDARIHGCVRRQLMHVSVQKEVHWDDVPAQLSGAEWL